MAGVDSAERGIRSELAFFQAICTCFPYLFFHNQRRRSTISTLNVLALLTPISRPPAQSIGIAVFFSRSVLDPVLKLDQDLTKTSQD